MSRVTFEQEVIQRKMAVAGWSITDLAQQAGISTPTVSAATKGRAVNIQSAVCIARALTAAVPVEGMADLLSAADVDEAASNRTADGFDGEEVTRDDDRA